MKTASVVLAALLLGASSAHAASESNALLFCGELTAPFGPYDYRDTSKAHDLFLVEQAHFTSNIERGESGNSGTLGGELNYTLRAFPNHIRALATLVRLSKNGKVMRLPGLRYPVECYFDRAIRFVPDDGMVRAAYGNFLYSQGLTERALPYLEQGAKLAPDNPSVQYNLGVALFRLKRFKEANQAAQNAYAAAFPLPGLRRMLTEAGAWDESVRPVLAKKEGEDEADGAAPADGKAAPKSEAKTEAKPETKPAQASEPASKS